MLDKVWNTMFERVFVAIGDVGVTVSFFTRVGIWWFIFEGDGEFAGFISWRMLLDKIGLGVAGFMF